MHILLSADKGEMQKRVCDANAVASLESMVLCEIADEAQVCRQRCKRSVRVCNRRGTRLDLLPRFDTAQINTDKEANPTYVVKHMK